MSFATFDPVTDENPLPIQVIASAGTFTPFAPVTATNPLPVQGVVTSAEFAKFARMTTANPLPCVVSPTASFSAFAPVTEANPLPVILKTPTAFDPALPVSDTNPLPIFEPMFGADVAASYSLTGASSDSTYLIDGSNRLMLVADRSGNSSENAFVSSGAASNTATTTTKSITGNKTFSADVRFADYTPSADHTLFTKLSGNNGIALLLLTTGVLRLRVGDGASITNVDSTASVGTTDLSRATFGVVWTDGVGASFTVDGVALGSAVAAAKTLTDASTTATIGTACAGVIYRLQVVGVYDFNPSGAEKLTSSFASGGDTWTINTSGDTGARICGARDLVQMTQANQPIYVAPYGAETTYTSNFSAGVDGWAGVANQSTVAGNVDGVSDGTTSYDNVFQLTQDSTSGGSVPHYAIKSLTQSLNGRKYILSGKYYIPSSQTDINGIRITAQQHSTQVYLRADSSTGQWVSFTSDPITPSSDGFAVYAEKGTAIDYTASNSTDKLYLVDLVLTLVPSAYPYAYFDGSNDYLKSAPGLFSGVGGGAMYAVGSRTTNTASEVVLALVETSSANARATVGWRNATAGNEGIYAGGRRLAANSFAVVGGEAYTASRLVATGVWNWASALMHVRQNRRVASTLDPFQTAGLTEANAGALTVGANPAGSSNLNGTFSELIIRNAADSESVQMRIAGFLMRKWGVS